MHFKTEQGVKIQKLFETLAPLLVEGNIIFSKSGIKLNSITSSLFANFELKAENLDEYRCEGEYVAGVNFPTLFKYFKTVTQNDAIAIQLTQEGFNAATPVLFVHIITSSMTYSYRYSLLAIDEVPFNVPPQKYDTVVRISSVAFLRALRSCEQVGESVQILSRATPASDDIASGENENRAPSVVVYIVCEGLQSSLQVTISASNEEPAADDEPDVSNTSDKKEMYSLKFLNYIAKATSLNSTVQLFLAKEYALIIRYRVGKLGHVTFGMPPRYDESNITLNDIDGYNPSATTALTAKRKLMVQEDARPLHHVFANKKTRVQTPTARPATATTQQQYDDHPDEEQHQDEEQHDEEQHDDGEDDYDDE